MDEGEEIIINIKLLTFQLSTVKHRLFEPYSVLRVCQNSLSGKVLEAGVGVRVGSVGYLML